MIINNSRQAMLNPIIKINNNIYLPISDMTMVYNIDVDYIEGKNRVIIDSLNKGIIKAMIAEKTDIKFKPKKLSKSLGTVNEGQSVYCFYTTSKGWRQIRTQDGTLRIYKSK